MAKIVYLVGFMGTGKTVVGKLVAKELGLQFIDIDSLIEKQQGKKIGEIFADVGESYFRSLEKHSLAQVSQNKDVVISCGGGIVLDKQNMLRMKQTGVIICLSASPEVVFARTHRHGNRPLLNVDNPEARIKELLELRAPFYAQADYTIDTSDFSIQQIVQQVIEYARPEKD